MPHGTKKGGERRLVSGEKPYLEADWPVGRKKLREKKSWAKVNEAAARQKKKGGRKAAEGAKRVRARGGLRKDLLMGKKSLLRVVLSGEKRGAQ